MLIKDYSKIALTTAIYNKEGYMNIAYPTLGLIGELGEVKQEYKLFLSSSSTESQVAKEIGDALWYMNALCDSVNLPLPLIDEEFTRLTNFKTLNDIQIMSELAELIKKGWRDEQGNLSKERLFKIKQLLVCTLALLRDYARSINYTLDEIMEINIEKLLKRKENGKIQGSGSNR